MDHLIQNLAETLVYIRGHGPEMSELAEIRKKLNSPPQIKYPASDEMLHLSGLAGTLRSDALREMALVCEEHLACSEFDGLFAQFQQTRRDLIQWPMTVIDVQHAQTLLASPRSLFAFGMDYSTSDGAAAVASMHHLTFQDVPPWDTWVSLEKESNGCRYLISWVPDWAGELIDDAIAVSADECFSWMEYRNGKLELKGWGRAWQD